MPDLQPLAASLGVEVRDPELWLEALTHRSYTHEDAATDRCYERLEILGDALLSAAVTEQLWRQRPGASEGELSFLRSALVRRDQLAAWLQQTPARDMIRLGRGASLLDSAGRTSIDADVAEALLAVVYLENGWPGLQRVVAEGPAAQVPDYQQARREMEPKSILQERLAADGAEPPQYQVIAQDEAGFQVRVSWGGQSSCVGAGRNRREAESAAARRALDLMDERSPA